MSNIRINITDEQGILLDSAEISREEFEKAQEHAILALTLIGQFQIGKES